MSPLAISTRGYLFTPLSISVDGYLGTDGGAGAIAGRRRGFLVNVGRLQG